MTSISICNVDFDSWATLASSDPQRFEQLRQDKLSDYINRAPESRQQRLRGLQWRIDKLREQNKDSPMVSCLLISELMWDTFEHLSQLLQIQAENGYNAPISLPSADIVPFPTR